MEQIPDWMNKYIPAMMEQWDSVRREEFSRQDLEIYIENILPNNLQNQFITNMNIKISLLKIIYKEYKL